MNLDVPTHPARLLIVDDSRDNLELLTIILNWEGYETLTAESGEEALASVAAHRPDLVLLDLGLAGLSGYEVILQMQGNVATKHIPILIITGRGDDVTRRRVMSAGAVDFVVKPLERADLCHRVRNHLPPRTVVIVPVSA